MRIEFRAGARGWIGARGAAGGGCGALFGVLERLLRQAGLAVRVAPVAADARPPHETKVTCALGAAHRHGNDDGWAEVGRTVCKVCVMEAAIATNV